MFHDFLQQNHPARGTTQEAPKSCDNTGLALARVTTWPFLPGGPGGPGGILMDDGQGIHTFIYIYIYYIETYCIMLYMYNTTLYFILYFTISYYIILYHILLFHIISCYVYKLCPKEPCKKWSCVEKKTTIPFKLCVHTHALASHLDQRIHMSEKKEKEKWIIYTNGNIPM